MDHEVVRVGLVDDQRLVRAGFAMVLSSQPDLLVAWQAADGKEAVHMAQTQPVDVILMDIQMPVMNGIEAIRALRTNPAKIVVLTTFDADAYVIGALEHGASGFLLKDTEPEALIEAVRTVAAGDAVISPQATSTLLKHMRTSVPETASQRVPLKLIDPLTPREEEILVLMAKGLSNAEIARELYISMPTVKTHVGKVLAKTDSRDRVQAVLFAFRHGMVTQAELLRDHPRG
ncbi:response regulator [Corynebacterium pseudopelargi]|uniref:Response regulator protein VraR n=1 Tax=Corynebacterium pseudopelargi TaxID=2080757 RepID=A0A3G6IWP7_9CORY|nr:response regulator transcription factor [Corynebacterium pseudopelargi]AZA10066.1 Response regulator protein VraR [Corynebacterium pseudopelargi]